MHGWVFDSRFSEFGNPFLNEHEAPELKLEPVEILRGTIGRLVLRPACTLERIQAQVGQHGYINADLGAEPAIRLIEKAVLIIVDTHRPQITFAEIEDFVTVGRAFSGEHRGLVITVQVHLVGCAIQLFAFEQFVCDVRVARGCD
ncbi:hypothetical protein D3C76_1290210 [compost metagenome]